MRASAAAAAAIRVTVRNAADAGEWQIALSRRSIPDFAAGRMSASDLVVGDESGARWRRGNIALSPLPGHVVASHGRFRLFYEIYGAQANDPLRTEIVIAPGRATELGDRIRTLIERREGFTVSFDGSATVDADGSVRELRNIASNLQPGLYDVQVTITNARTGERVTATTSLRIASP
jgi:hypothetical protein